MKTKNLFVVFSTVVLVLIIFSSAVYSQGKEYPNRTVQVIVATSAGGGVDTLCRIIAEELKNIWKVPVNVLNKPGGGGALAGGEVAHADKDGYTVLANTSAGLGSISVANPTGPVNLFRDFDILAVHFAYAPNVLVTYGDSQFKSLEDVIDYAKKKPGELVCGVAKVGSDVALEQLLFNRAAKINIRTMNFEGTSQVTTAVLGKHIPLGFSGFIPSRPHIAAGKFRVLASDSKSSILDAPTFAEKGYPEVNVISSIVFAGPKGIQSTVNKAWEDAIREIIKKPSFVDNLKKLGYEVNFLMGDEKEKYLKDEIKNFSRFTTEELGWKK